MNIGKLLNDVGTKFNRVVQKTEETLLSAEKTEYDDEYKEMLKKIDSLCYWTDKFIKEASVALEPNLAFRLEEKVLDKLEKKNERVTPLETLGSVYEKAGEVFTPYSSDLGKCFATFGGIEVRVGATGKEFQKKANEVYVTKLKTMLNTDLKKFQDEHTILENMRLDLDSSRSRLKKSNDANRATNEENVTKADLSFNQQLKSNKTLYGDINKLFAEHGVLIKAFVSAQINYYAECQRELERLEKQL